jgi:Domain of unknown function (DUF1993)
MAQGLKDIEAWLAQAEHHASAKQFDVGVLMTSRLAPDMKDFVYQVQSACDYVKGAAAWLSGQTPPRHADTEKTVYELRARIRKDRGGRPFFGFPDFAGFRLGWRRSALGLVFDGVGAVNEFHVAAPPHRAGKGAARRTHPGCPGRVHPTSHHSAAIAAFSVALGRIAADVLAGSGR